MSAFPGSEGAYQAPAGGDVFGPRQARALQRISRQSSPYAAQPQYQLPQSLQQQPAAYAPQAGQANRPASQRPPQRALDMSWASPAASQMRQFATVRPNSNKPLASQESPASVRSPAMQKAMQEGDGRSPAQRLVDIQRAQNKERIWV